MLGVFFPNSLCDQRPLSIETVECLLVCHVRRERVLTFHLTQPIRLSSVLREMREQIPESIRNTAQEDAGRRWRALVYLSIAELFALSLWFSATAVLPALSSEWQLSDSGQAGLTIAVQVGFILGTLVSALGNLPDIYSPRILMAISAALGAAANGALALWVDNLATALMLRVITAPLCEFRLPPIPMPYHGVR